MALTETRRQPRDLVAFPLPELHAPSTSLLLTLITGQQKGG